MGDQNYEYPAGKTPGVQITLICTDCGSDKIAYDGETRQFFCEYCDLCGFEPRVVRLTSSADNNDLSVEDSPGE